MRITNKWEGEYGFDIRKYQFHVVHRNEMKAVNCLNKCIDYIDILEILNFYHILFIKKRSYFCKIRSQIRHDFTFNIIACRLSFKSFFDLEDV